jgi:hypothetical protein
MNFSRLPADHGMFIELIGRIFWSLWRVKNVGCSSKLSGWIRPSHYLQHLYRVVGAGIEDDILFLRTGCRQS